GIRRTVSAAGHLCLASDFQAPPDCLDRVRPLWYDLPASPPSRPELPCARGQDVAGQPWSSSAEWISAMSMKDSLEAAPSFPCDFIFSEQEIQGALPSLMSASPPDSGQN